MSSLFNLITGLFSFTYLLYLCEHFSSVEARCARDLASKC